MKKFLFILGIISIGIIILVYGVEQKDVKNPVQEVVKKEVPSTPALKPDINFGKIPLYFIQNRGQVNKAAQFYAKASRYTLWLTKEGLVFDSTRTNKNPKSEARNSMLLCEVPRYEAREQIPNPKSKFPKQREINSKLNTQNSKLKTKIHRDVSRLMFLGANKNPTIIPVNETKLRVNFFKGNDPSKWIGNIPTSQAVLYKNLYKNIDLKVYGIEKQIEYDWIVKPGGDPENIRFEYKNVKKPHIDKEGNLVITTKFGELIHKRPVSYQREGVGADLRVCPPDTINEKRTAVNATFKQISKNIYGFKVAQYDKNKALIIDPVVLVYSTYLGGGSNDYGYRIAVDGSGYTYVTGYTDSTDFPTLNQYQTDPTDTAADIFVTKLDTTQSGSSSLLYSTYLGGANGDIGFGITVDSSGNAYVTGYTDSTDFPTLNQYQTDPTDTAADVFVTKLDTTQSGTSCLLYSTYLGGDSYDRGYGIAVDNSGYTFVTGQTGSTDFPTLGQYQSYLGGGDVFVTKLDTTQSGTNSLLYSTYLGGSSYEVGNCIAVDGDGNAYVTGYTAGPDFPTLSYYQADQGSDDVFVTRLDTTQSGTASLLYSTYLGGAGGDIGFGITVDSSGNAYVTGWTKSTNFPILNQYMSDPGDSFNEDAFVAKLDTTQSGTTSLLYSTYLGGNSGDFGYGIALDSSGNAYVTGYTDSADFPTLNQYQTDPTDTAADVFVTKLDTTQSGSTSLLYSTYLGGNSGDSGYGIALDSSGNAYVAGITESTDFPTLNQYMTEPGDGYYDAFVTMLIFVGQNPIIITKSISSLTATSASCVGVVISEGDSGVTVRGVCWSTSSNPTIWDDYTMDGSGLGSFTSSITGLTPETTYYVRAYAANNDGLDYGDQIQFTTLPVSITVTSPNGGETWCTSTTENITWIPDGLTNTLYIILQQNDANVALIDKNIDPSFGTYAWTVGDARLGTVVAGVNYKILLKEKGSTVKDKSDAVFTIIDPYITVTSPNGGENWKIGNTETITWNSAGLTDTLYIILEQYGINVALIQKNINPSLGTYSWTVGDCRTGYVFEGVNYKILIKVKGSTLKDKSDGAFMIMD
jgi:hypothetical protein